MRDLAVSRRALLGSFGALAGTAFLPRMAWGSAAAEAKFPTVARMLDGYVSTGKLPGMIAAIGWGAGEAPLDIARGNLAKGEAPALDLDSLFRIYSMTKPITGMAAMMLVDEGKLRLDQPVADLLPAFGKMMVQATPDGSITDLRPAKTQITVRHLLTHTAGLGYSIIQNGPIKDAFIKAGVVPGQASRLPTPGMDGFKPLGSLAEFADVLATLPLVYEPGTVWSYSVGLDLLGRVIEVASGKPFDAFLDERVFAPCGMTSTWFRVPESEAGRLTTNYAAVGGMLLPIDPGKTSIYLDQPPYPFGGAGLVSSPRDYDRFQRMLLGFGRIDGRQVMSEAAVRLGTSNLLPVGTDLSRSFIKGNGFGAGGSVGLGEDAGTYGWAGAAGTVGFVNFRVGLRAGCYTQYMPSEAYPVHREFAQAVLADVTGKKAAA
ncbi:MAG: serine hydrolase [Novosphingobium sp. 17-62-19]|uniref:serine hydrolase domain-containing protein n=1 Tax=Novosphingobium sp. 17-62-19 TaxID=1970406 RepID=UPI000BD97490|nr:serine hydrolase domain-containing protein [Novosphingobium sp. 17-62-19]OZA20961.1 MAG: serine hydrolase [Novosphingobium sp. 17-62-19]HQS95452.1 serine hydrolase domain-containing protein [Novosphingobium sp.]